MRHVVAARAAFAQDAHGWLAAYAEAHGHVLVTHEAYAAQAKRRMPLPNLCTFAINSIDTFGMLRRLEARFRWEQHAPVT